MATQVISCIRDTFKLDLPVCSVFEAPTIDGLAQRVQELGEKAVRAGAKITMTSRYEKQSLENLAKDVYVFPLSFAQQRLWFLDQLEPNRSVYNVANAIRLKGPLSVGALEQSLNEIVRRHEALRTSFSMVEGQPIQVISSSFILPLPLLDLSNLSDAQREVEAQRLADEEAQRPFDLARGPLLRSKLVRLGADDHVLLVTMHHIVSDGWSMEVFFRELSVLYEAFSKGKPSTLGELPIQYVDYAAWQRDRLKGEILDIQLSYWKEQLENVPTLQLPTDWPRPAVQSFRGARHSLVLSQDLTNKLRVLSRKEGVTLFMVLLAAFQALLNRLTGEEDDIVVGSPIAGRNRSEFEGLIGFFLNTLVLRTDLSGNPTFKELLARVRQVALGAYAHQDVPFEKLLEELRPERDLSRTPLFQVYFNMLNVSTVKLPGLTVERLSHNGVESKFDLTVYVRERGETIHFAFVYNADLFHRDRMKQMLEHFQTLLQGIVANPDQRLSDLPLLTDDERRLLSTRYNLVRSTEPFVEFEKEAIEQSIADRFEEQVKKFPDHVAVKTRRHQWTYNELNRTANQIAQTILQACGCGEQRIGLLFEHDAPMIAGILGMLKAGKTYVPLDPTFPAERLSSLLEDSQSTVVLTNRGNIALAKILTNEGVQLIIADEIDANVSTVNPNLPISPDTLAYILYTSGSTGMPKGVMQNHRNVLHHIRNYTNNLHLNSDDRLTLFSSYGFDAAVMDIFGALLNGASLHPMDIKEEDPSALFHRVTREKITVYHSTPTVFRYLMKSLTGREDLSKIRFVVLGGEEVHREDIDLFKEIFSAHSIFINGLGPSESTVTLQYFINHETEITGNIVPVGYAVEGTDVLLLNKEGKQGEVYGEIGIRSAHVALGYWRKPEMTKAAFLPDPHCGSKRIYRTGDLGRLLPDGSIAFVRRKDFQVKIRGIRVELGEIESALAKHPGVREAVAVLREDGPNDKRLVAYVVPEEKHAAAATELRGFLKRKLPDYMIPSAILMLDSLPLTPNGKIDNRALPVPEANIELQETFYPPRTAVEEALTRIWAEILSTDKVGVRHNFFELGGHSLLATKVMSRIRDSFQVELALRMLFEKPTVEELAVAITEKQAEGIQKEQQVSSILAELESLSEEETQRQLLKEDK